MGEDEGWPVEVLNHLGHGEGLARAGYAEQDLVLVTRGNAGDDLFDGPALIAARLIVTDELKVHSVPVRCYSIAKDASVRLPALSTRWRGHGVVLLAAMDEPAEHHPDCPEEGSDDEQDGQEDDGRKYGCVASHAGAISRMNSAAKEDEIAADGGVAVQIDVAAEDDHVAACALVHVNAAEEYDDVTFDRPPGIDRT